MGFLKSTIAVSLCTLISRIFGFIRDRSFAKYLGSGMASDVFFTAFRLPNFFRSLFAEGAFSSAFIPICSAYLMSGNRDETMKFFRNIFSLLLYFVLIFTLIAEIFMPNVVNVIAIGFLNNIDKYQLTVSLARVTFPYLIFISLVSFMSGILYSYGKFAVVALNPLILNLIFILASHVSVYFSMDITRILSFSVLIGGFIQFLCILITTMKHGIVLYPTRIKIDQTTKIFMLNFLSALMGAGTDQITAMFSSIMASKIPGATSYLYYSDRLVQLPMALIGTAMGVSILPLLSKKTKQNDDERFEIQENALLITLFLGLPCAIYMYRLSYIFIPILFERGAFTRASSLAVTGCIKISTLALPAFISSKIFQSIFFANGDTKTPMISAVVSLFSIILLNPVFIKYFSYRGIVLASVVSAHLDSLILLFILLKRKQLILSDGFLLSSVKIFYSLIFMFLTLEIADKFIPMGQTLTSQFIKLTATATSSGIVYLTVSYLQKIIDFRKYVRTDG